MGSYVSSNANRFYTVLENSYGGALAAQAANRIPALKLTIQQQLETNSRRDKTGSRTFAGVPMGGRKRTNFELQTYLTSWDKSSGGPSYGPMFQAGLGAQPLSFGGGTVSSGDGNGRLVFTSPHGLNVGQAIATGGEIRFVAAIVDANAVQLNVPFTIIPASGSHIETTVTYLPATELPSVTIYDYWSPSSAVQRMLCGAAVDQMQILLNGDYHEFHFSGIAQDVVDSASFSAGSAQLQSLPPEPPIAAFDYSIVPGNMGQAWLGASAARFFTITSATVAVNNSLDARSKEFGSALPRAISPGQRSVSAAFDLYGLTDDATKALYQAARQQSPISVMFQLGALDGQVMSVNLKSVIPEVPEFDDSGNRLQWHFRASRAVGTVDDEIAIAFA